MFLSLWLPLLASRGIRNFRGRHPIPTARFGASVQPQISCQPIWHRGHALALAADPKLACRTLLESVGNLRNDLGHPETVGSLLASFKQPKNGVLQKKRHAHLADPKKKWGPSADSSNRASCGRGTGPPNKGAIRACRSIGTGAVRRPFRNKTFYGSSGRTKPSGKGTVPYYPSCGYCSMDTGILLGCVPLVGGLSLGSQAPTSQTPSGPQTCKEHDPKKT